MPRRVGKTRGGKTKGGSLHSIWDNIIHPIDNWKERKRKAADEEEGYDILDGLTDSDIEDLLSGIKRRSKKTTPKKNKAAEEESIKELLRLLQNQTKDPKPAGKIEPIPPPPSWPAPTRPASYTNPDPFLGLNIE